MLSTDNQIVKGKAQNWKKKREKGEKKKICNFSKQKIVFQVDKSNTGVYKQKHAEERRSINMNNMS